MRAAFEPVAIEPLVEDIEDSKETVARRVRALLYLGAQPVLGPELMAEFHECRHQFLLRLKMPVERHLGDAGMLDDRVDPDRSRTLL